MLDLQDLLRHAAAMQASDVHVKADAVPRVRIDGHLVDAPFAAVPADELERLVVGLLSRERAVEFSATNDAEFALSSPDHGRYRGNAFRQRGAAGLVLRRLLATVPSLDELELPAVVRRLADERRGLVLVTGPTGSGKSTTLASMIDHISRTRAVNVVTIEDPIEICHTDQLALVNQREIGVDTGDYPEAVRRVLRQDPDVILIGEMRDPETVAAALSASETGHLVLSALHTTNATETVNRIVDFFPLGQQRQVRLTLASCLNGVVSQRLIERAHGAGRVPAVEVMIMTGRIAERIADPDSGKGEPIEDMIASGEWYGMQTFDQSLFRLYEQGRIELRIAMAAASRPHDLRIALEQAGLVATS